MIRGVYEVVNVAVPVARFPNRNHIVMKQDVNDVVDRKSDD